MKIFVKMLILSFFIISLQTPAFSAESKQTAPNQQELKKDVLEEAFDLILAEIEKVSPEKAAELRKIRAEEPAIFQNLLRTNTRTLLENGEELLIYLDEKVQLKRISDGLHIGGRMQLKYNDLIEWLSENYPGDAQKLNKMKEANPKLFVQQMTVYIRKFGQIVQTAQYNPQLADLMKQALELDYKKHELTSKILEENNSEKKQAMIEELKKVIAKKYDVIIAQKELAYKTLQAKLQSMKFQLKESEEKIAKWKSPELRKLNVEKRLEQLLSEQNEFDWN